MLTRGVILGGVLVAVVAGGGIWWLVGASASLDETEPSSVATAETGQVEEATDRSDSSPVVRLSKSKVATAGIETQVVGQRTLVHTDAVPGRLEYDGARLLELRLPVESVVSRVLVQPGEYVEKGARLVVLASKQVGMARDAVQQCEEDLALAREQLAWHEQIGANVNRLLDDLAQSPQISDVVPNYRNRPLGTHRETLLSAYSAYVLAEQTQQDMATIGSQGVLSGRMMNERKSALERSRATFQGICEETRHAVTVESRTAAMDVARAERALLISSEHLASLLGPYASRATTASGETTPPSAASAASSAAPPQDHAATKPLSELILTAPFAGRIEKRHVTAAEVVAANVPLLTLANTDQLWVSAQIHERNWQATFTAVGQGLTVRTPATGERTYQATINFVGAAVDPETHAVPLIATIDNSDRQLKPGMFAWITVPIEPPRETLAARSSAVMRHKGQAFVFVADAPDAFRRVDVTTGLETEDWIEICSGLAGGEEVATSGVFALKSELLLEQEEE